MAGYIITTEHSSGIIEYPVYQKWSGSRSYWYARPTSGEVAIVGLLPPELEHWNADTFSKLCRIVGKTAILGSSILSIDQFVDRSVWTAQSPDHERYLLIAPMPLFHHSGIVLLQRPDTTPSGEHNATRAA